MITQKGENTFVTAIKGNFDDAQRKVKELFNDAKLRSKMAENNKDSLQQILLTLVVWFRRLFIMFMRIRD